MNNEQEKQIEKIKFLLRELSAVQEVYFNTLADELDLEEGDENLLFDYLFNETEEETFGEFLSKFSNAITDSDE